MKERKPTELLQKIFDLRRAKKITLTELGKVLGGVTPEAASRIENGDLPLKAEYVPQIAKLLGVTPWELFVDYKAKEVGPMSHEEITLILNFRKIASKTKREALKDMAEACVDD